MKSLLLSVVLSGMALSARAATVAQGSTLAGDAGGIDLVGAAVSVAAGNPAYFNGATDPVSEWVWASSGATAQFQFTFDMTGYDLSTASLFGEWGVDNNGTVSLNGTQLASLGGSATGNFSMLHAYGTSDAGLFNSGLNTLSFALVDTNAPAAFRATATVSVDTATVPLPAGGALLVAALGALGLSRRRKG